jgi:hypothetical protein
MKIIPNLEYRANWHSEITNNLPSLSGCYENLLLNDPHAVRNILIRIYLRRLAPLAPEQRRGAS